MVSYEVTSDRISQIRVTFEVDEFEFDLTTLCLSRVSNDLTINVASAVNGLHCRLHGLGHCIGLLSNN